MSPLPHFLDDLPDRWPQTPCSDEPHLFVSTNSPTPSTGATEKARRLCGGCPVRQGCLDHAINSGVRDGIWGGLTPDERDQLVRRRTEPAEPGR